MKSLEVERQVLEIKINPSRVLYGLKIKVFKPEKTSNQIKILSSCVCKLTYLCVINIIDKSKWYLVTWSFGHFKVYKSENKRICGILQGDQKKNMPIGYFREK